jgi:hypothetical protein
MAIFGVAALNFLCTIIGGLFAIMISVTMRQLLLFMIQNRVFGNFVKVLFVSIFLLLSI